jgi:hypothetical protein
LVSAHNGRAANVKDSVGRLPLHLAVINACGDDIFTLLLDHTTNLNETDSSGKTVLEEAVRGNHQSHLAKLLATKRVDIMKRTRSGRTVFAVAAGDDLTSKAILELLYSAHPPLLLTPDDGSELLTPLHHALLSSGEHRNEKVRYLLSLPEASALIVDVLSNPRRPKDFDRWFALLSEFIPV